MVSIVFEGYACIDCAVVIANDDDSGVSDSVREEWERGMENVALYELGNIVVGDEYNEFSTRRCDSCGTHLAGARQSIAVLSN